MLKDLKEVLFAHCSVAADKAIGDPADQKNRHDGGKRQDEAAYTALLGVIADAGLAEEYRQYSSERRKPNENHRNTRKTKGR